MRERWIVGGLVLLVVADVLLVSLAFRHVGNAAPAASSGGQAAGQPTAQATKHAPSADPGPVAFLSMRVDGTLLRASRGDCRASTTPGVTVSTDTGKTFTTSKVPGLREVIDAQASSARGLVLIGLGDSCRVARFASDDDGKTWNERAGGGTTWHLLPDAKSRSVHSPVGPKPVPCRPVKLSTPVPGLVRLLCLDGRIYGTDDVGATWPYLGRLSGAVDIDFTGPLNGFAIGKGPDCPAAVMRTVDGGGTWSQITCLPGHTPRVIATAGNVVAAQVDDHLVASLDDGITWPGATRP